MKPHQVIAEMVDHVTDTRKQPGDMFTPHDEAQAKRLIDAGCLAAPVPRQSRKDR